MSMAIIFDALTHSRRPQEVNLPTKQANAHAELMADFVSKQSNYLATKADLRKLHMRIEKLDMTIDKVDNKVEGMQWKLNTILGLFSIFINFFSFYIHYLSPIYIQNIRSKLTAPHS